MGLNVGETIRGISEKGQKKSWNLIRQDKTHMKQYKKIKREKLKYDSQYFFLAGRMGFPIP